MKYFKRSISILLMLSIFLTMAVGTVTVNASASGNSDDYRTWTHRDSRWSSTPMGSTTLGDGGAPTTAITKLAIQAGLRDAHDFDIGDMAGLLSYSGKSVVWNSACTAPNLFSQKYVFYNNDTGTASSGKISAIISDVQQGWHIVIGVKNSSGTNFVAVDEKLTLASGSAVYVMDCTTNTSNNINVSLTKRYGTITKIIGYKGEASQNSSIDSDYRKWELNNSNWADTVLNGTSTMNNSRVGGGDLVLASAKLAIQAGSWSEDTEGGVNSVNRAKNAVNDFTTGGVINDWNSIKNALFGLTSTVSTALIGDVSNTTQLFSTSDTDANNNNINDIIDNLNLGYYLAIRINSSVGWVAVDTDKTLATGEVYVMRSTADASKNADIKLSDYYDKMNCVAGFKPAGVQVSFSGNATFTASYTKSGNTVSFSSGAFVPNEADVTVTAAPESGYTAADDWTISGGYSGTHTATTYSFTTNTETSTTANITYNPTPKSYDISYTYGTNSTSFTYTTVPSAATTGATVNMTISPKTDGSFVYELKVDARDSENHQIPVTHSGTTYSFKMPASDVTVTFTGQNVDDWRRWARDDERWRDYEMVTQTDVNPNVVHTVQSDGAVMLSLAKIVLQAGLETPSTTAEHIWDVRDTVDSLATATYVDMGDGARGLLTKTGKLVFSNNTYKPPTYDNSATALGFDSITTVTSDKTLLDKAYLTTMVNNLLNNGFHQIIRLAHSSVTNSDDLSPDNSEWFVIDEESTLVKGNIAEVIADSNSTAQDIMESIYIFRATADTSKNAYHTLQELFEEKNSTYNYVWRNYAYTGGTTPARQVNITLKNGGTAVTDAHKGTVTGTYTIADEDAQSFVSGGYVPSRATIKIKYNADPGYFAFENWTTGDSAVMTSFAATETSNPKDGFKVNASEFRPTGGGITHSTTANIDCNITPEIYHIDYAENSNVTFSKKMNECGYNETASFTATPASGFRISEIVVSDESGNELKTLTGGTVSPSGFVFSFTMPAKDVTVTVTTTESVYTDYRMWGVNDSRWNTETLGSTAVSSATDASIVFAMAKLMIQCGYTPTGTTVYSPTTYSTEEANMESVISKSSAGFSSGALSNDTTDGTSCGWGIMAKNLGIIPVTYLGSDTGKYYCTNGATAGGDSNRTQQFMFKQLLKDGDGNGKGTSSRYDADTFTQLIKDYVSGQCNTSFTNGGTGTGHYDFINNTQGYHLNVLLQLDITVNDVYYGWVAVDAVRTLNTGKIWVWASVGDTSAANVFSLESKNITTFRRAAGFKFSTSNTSYDYGYSQANFTPYVKTNNNTGNWDYADIDACYYFIDSNNGVSEMTEITTGQYVPKGATVKLIGTPKTGYIVADSMTVTDTYKPWYTDYPGGVTPSLSTSSEISFTLPTSSSASVPVYNTRFYTQAIPQVHVKYLGDANGTVNGAGATASAAADIYQGDTVSLTVTPAANYEIETLVIKKVSQANFTGNNFDTVISTEGLDPDETSITFGSELTGGEESWFVVQAAFKGVGLRITYNFKEFDPSLAGTHEYKEGDGYLVNKTYTKEIDAYAGTLADAVSKVAANVPVLQNVYFDYTCTPSEENVTYNNEGSVHTASVTLTPVVKEYTVSVNGTPIDSVYHYQEELALDASDFNVDSDNVVWTRNAESGKTGSAKVCYDTVYSFRVTSELNLTVAENLSNKSSVDGSSVITPGYTEIDRVNNVEKCIQNFYIQDFYDRSSPKVYDSDGDVIEGASDITFLGAGVMFYAFDTNTNKPAKTSLGETEPTREGIYSVLNTNKNAFLSEATGSGGSFKGSNFNYSYIKASTDNNSILRYSTTTDSYNYFFSASINNNRTAENQKYVYRVYSFYVCSYTLNGNTYVVPVLSDSYAQAKLYPLSE
ncbi:MAG: hypothetical protein K6F88_08125 [Ruminococcus sp.]|nr:hypothetical protein [Ruminococcus sp.]